LSLDPIAIPGKDVFQEGETLKVIDPLNRFFNNSFLPLLPPGKELPGKGSKRGELQFQEELVGCYREVV